MFGFGFWEIVIIALAVIVFVRPKELPKLFFRIGKVYGQLQDFNRSVRQSMRSFERQFDDTQESRSPRPEGERQGKEDDDGKQS